MANYVDAANLRNILTYALDYTSTSASTQVFGAWTNAIRIAGTSAFHYRILDAAINSTCTSADPLVPNGWVEIKLVTPGQRLSAIKASGGTITSADGRITVTELG